MSRNPRFAVILSGCGRTDGSEIHESVTALLNIDNNGCEYQCFAPNISQSAVINNITLEKMPETRNVLVEAARIARGDIKDITLLDLDEFDCILLPGGMGAITNWCDFQNKGIDCNVENSISKILELAYIKEKVIGAMCIAPVVLAKVLGRHGVTITIGNDEKIAKMIEEMGAHHKNTKVEDACVDRENKVITTSAYMLATSIKEVNLGASSLIKEMIKLAQ